MFCKPSLSFLLGSELKTIFSNQLNSKLAGITTTFPIRARWSDVKQELPKPGHGKYYRRIAHYPEKYTIKGLKTTNLAGRDPVTGRVIVGTLGGGLKHPFLWVDYKRLNPPDQPSLIEKVLEIIPEPNRTAHVALVGSGDKLRYLIATENMKPGDLITTCGVISRIPVRAKEGDAYPLASLPVGTEVCCIEQTPGMGGYHARAAGTYATIVRKYDDRVVCMLNGVKKSREASFDHTCMAVVGHVSNKIHMTIPIGSANRLRWLGYRPRSGLFQRKTGKHGRKIRPPPPCLDYHIPLPKPCRQIRLTLDEFPFHKP